MQSENLPTALRRSSRVPAELPIRVTSLSGARFSEVCKTLVVNAHGCALQTPMRFDTGIPLRFHSDDGRETTAHVVSCQPLGSGNGSWKLAAKLDRPEYDPHLLRPRHVHRAGHRHRRMGRLGDD